MIPILLSVLLGAVAAPEAGDTSLSVARAANRTEVVIRVDGGTVSVKDFALANPHRVVLDITGARQGANLDFSGINRGGVAGLRVSQYQRGVVRVVVDLEQRAPHKVQQNGDEIRISFPNPTGEFETWSSNLSARVAKAEPAKVSQPERVEAKRPAVQQRRTPRVTVSFDNEPIMNVLLTFSDFAGRSIVASPDVRQVNVTADVKDQPWDVALDAILAAHGLAAHENDSGIIIVEKLSAIKQRQADEPQETRAFPIKFASADTLRASIEGMLTPSTGKVTVNPTANTLLITDTRSSLERIGPI